MKRRRRGIGYKIRFGTISVAKGSFTVFKKNDRESRPYIIFEAQHWSIIPGKQVGGWGSFTLYNTLLPFPGTTKGLHFRVPPSSFPHFSHLMSAARSLGALAGEDKSPPSLLSYLSARRIARVLVSNSRVRSRLNSNNELEFKVQNLPRHKGNRHTSTNESDRGERGNQSGTEVWMTHAQLIKKMLEPSITETDFRVSQGMTNYQNRKVNKEQTSTLRVTVLQATGLPKLDSLSKTDPYVVLVFEGNIFRTDIIEDAFSPVWLPHQRRTAIFPVYSPYTRLYCGVWDDDGPMQQDDFAGRCVVETGKLSPGTHDLVFRLRTSAVAYSRSPRGLLRIRIEVEPCMDTKSLSAPSLARSMIMRYIAPPPKASIPVTSHVDNKAIRIITYTLYGRNLPGVFNDATFDAVGREFDLYVERFKFELNVWLFNLRFYGGREGGFRAKILSLLIYAVLTYCTIGKGGLSTFFSAVLSSLLGKLVLNRFEPRTQGSDDDHVEFPCSEGEYYPAMSPEDCCATTAKLSTSAEDNAVEETLAIEDGSGATFESSLSERAEETSSNAPNSPSHRRRRRRKGHSLENKTTPYTYVEQDVNKRKTFVVKLEEKIGRMQLLANALTGNGNCEDRVLEVSPLSLSSLLQFNSDDKIPLVNPKSGSLNISNLYFTMTNKSQGPIFKIKAKFAVPVLNALTIFNNAIRGIYHLFVWRDDLSSSVFAAFLAAAVVLIYTIPWRWMFWMAGTAFIGPQNYFLRKTNDLEAEDGDSDDGMIVPFPQSPKKGDSRQSSVASRSREKKEEKEREREARRITAMIVVPDRRMDTSRFPNTPFRPEI